MLLASLERFVRELPAGAVVFEEGAAGQHMYVVQSGEIEIRRRFGTRERVVAVLAAGEFLGELALLTGRPRSATAVVRRDARLLAIDPTTFEAMVRARPEIALRLIRSLASRLERANQQLELVLLPTPDHRVVQCLRLRAAAAPQAPGARPGAARLVLARLDDLAVEVTLPPAEVAEVIARLCDAGLIHSAVDDLGEAPIGWLVPEDGRLVEFLDYLTLGALLTAEGRAPAPGT